MKSRNMRFLFLIMGLIFIVSAGCAGQAKQSGFLGDYPQFQKGPSGGADWVYLKPGVDFSKYNKVMLDPVVFFLKEDSKYKGIDADQFKELADSFHKAAIDALAGGYPIVSDPGPDVLRVRVAITDIEVSKPALSAVTTVVPMGLAMSTIKKGVTGKHTGVGGASMEAELLDSQTNDRLAAAIDEKSGSKLSGLTKYGAAKEAFEFWSKRLRKFLDEAHGKK